MSLFSAEANLASARRTRSSLLDRWQLDERPHLTTIRDAALDLLKAIEGRRERTYRAEDVANLDAYAADLSGTTLDLLNNLHGARLKEADEAGIANDRMPLDLLELELQASLWKTRSEARERRAA